MPLAAVLRAEWRKHKRAGRHRIRQAEQHAGEGATQIARQMRQTRAQFQEVLQILGAPEVGRDGSAAIDALERLPDWGCYFPRETCLRPETTSAVPGLVAIMRMPSPSSSTTRSVANVTTPPSVNVIDPVQSLLTT
jgi:hypothetical protein